MGLVDDGLHVVLAPGPVIDLREQHGCHILADGLGHLLRRDRPQLIALLQQPHQSFGHIEVRGKVTGIAQNHTAVRPQFDRGSECLKYLDGQRITHDDRALGRPDDTAHHVAHPRGLVHPAGLVPAADQHITPFIGQHGLNARADPFWQRAQRIAIQIDHAFGYDKLIFSQHVRHL